REFDKDISVYELIRVKHLKDLMSYLTSRDSQLRRRSIELLGQSQNEEALPHLLEALKDPDEDVRVQAALAIGKLLKSEDTQIVESMMSWIREEKSDRAISS